MAFDNDVDRIFGTKASNRGLNGASGKIGAPLHESDLKDNSIRAPIDSHRARIESPRDLKPVPISSLGDGERIAWAWLGYLAMAHITLLTGLWKAGKTTLIANLLKCFGAGGESAGTVNPGRVLLISEESRALWARRRDDVGIGDHVHVLCRPFLGRPRPVDWVAFIDRIATWIVADAFNVVMFDTIAPLLPIQDENDAAAMLAALGPLHAITATGAAVLLVHHPRKGDAGEGQASRGSGALPGFVDIIVELRRYDASNHEDRRRVLTAYSRFDETSPETVIELGDEGYRTVGNKADAKQSDRLREIGELLPADSTGLSADEVRDQWLESGTPKPGKRTVQSDLKHGADKGMWSVAGKGTKGDPLRYFRLNSIRAGIPS